jgi:hypothetical protein
MTTPRPQYKRRPPPFAAQCALGVFMQVVRPTVWCLEKLGLTQRVADLFLAGSAKQVKARNPFRTYTPTSHDVFVATYVKSGTNWMMQIAHQLLNHGEADFEHIHCVVPWPDTALMGPMRRYAVPVDDPSAWMASPENKRVIKTHYNWELLPYSKESRYIMVIRDPKDVFVSSYFFFAKNGAMGDTGISVETWFKMFLSEKFLTWGSWAANAAGYWAERHRPNVLVMSFKAMKRDLRAAVRTVAAFLGMDPSDAVVERVCEKSSLEYMKRIDEKFRMWRMIPWVPAGPMVRKGVHGGSAELLSIEQQRQVDAYFIAELKRLGSDLPYAEFCDLA